MTEREERRLALVTELLSAKNQFSIAFSQYLATGREYGGGDTLHMREAHFLVAVEPGAGKTMSEVAERLGVTQGAVSQTASRLERKGYLVRRRDEQNHRQIVASLTEKGERFYWRHLRYDQERYLGLDKRLLSVYSDEDLKALVEYEKRMCHIFEKQDLGEPED